MLSIETCICPKGNFILEAFGLGQCKNPASVSGEGEKEFVGFLLRLPMDILLSHLPVDQAYIQASRIYSVSH